MVKLGFLVDTRRCIGCQTCMAVRPYGAPQVVEKLETYYPGEETPYKQIPVSGGEEVPATQDRGGHCDEMHLLLARGGEGNQGGQG